MKKRFEKGFSINFLFLSCLGFYLIRYYTMREKPIWEIKKVLEKFCVTLNFGKSNFCKDYINEFGVNK